MLLDRIDIDSHGPLERVSLGPFAQTLNAIVAASGSGKTALVRFLRDSLTGTTPTRQGLAQSSGRVVWAAADGLYHCRREPNGSVEGRRFVELESRFASHRQHQRIGSESIVIDLPACVVDGIVTDTVLTNVHRCVQAAIASGLDHASVRVDNSREIEITQLRNEIAELERQIHSHTLHSQHASAQPQSAYESFGLTLDMKRLRDRRAELTLEISAIDARSDWATKADAEMDRRRRKREMFAAIADEIERLRRQESDLRMRLAEVESALEKMDDEVNRTESRSAIAKAYRNRLEQVDAQLVRVRRVVHEIRALGDKWFGGRGLTAQAGWLEQAIDGVARVADDFSLDHDARLVRVGDDRGELDIVDRGWSSALANSMRIDDSVAASSVDVQHRIDAICRLVDNLVGRCEEHQSEKVRPELDDISGPRTSNWDSWAESEMSRHERRRHPGLGAIDSMRSREAWASDDDAYSHRRRTDLDRVTPADPADIGERFEPIRSLDRAERLLNEERNYRVDSLTHAGENIAWIAGILNGISQRLRGLAGRRAAYGASNVDPLFHTPHDANSITDISNLNAQLDPSAQVAAVRRCERELVEVLRHLVVRRDVMLRRIAEAQNQPLSQVVAALSDTQVAHDDPQLYQWLVRDRITASESDAKYNEAARRRLAQQRDNLSTDLKRTLSRTTDRVAEAETLRMYMRSLPVIHRYDDDARLRSRLVAEVVAIDAQLSKPRVSPSILERHAQCVTRLRALTNVVAQASGLAAAATEYLRKLSGGRLNSVIWHRGLNASGLNVVEIDGRNEVVCNVMERFLAAVAVRLAAVDELARRGRALPVVIETPSLRQLDEQGQSQELRSILRSGIDAIAEYARRGRQILLLTDDAVVADAIMQVGGSVFSMQGIRRDVHTRRRSINAPTERMFDVNRDFDLAWREANGDDTVSRREERGIPQAPLDDFSESAFDRQLETVGAGIGSGYGVERTVKSNGRAEAIDTPFFLNGHSPIDQAPSIDSAAVARLRAVGVLQVENLLAASPKQLADQLQVADVDASVVRRWQHECRLMCGVRKLRSFDARVLVGCGITHPRELSELDARTLVERVEAFLATERGSRILKSGTSQEIQRLTEWIDQSRSKVCESRPETSRPEARRPVPVRPEPSRPVPSQTTSRFAEIRRPERRAEPVRELRSQEIRDQKPREFQPREQPARVSSPPEAQRPATRSPRKADKGASVTPEFYLHRSSDVEAGPSIGPRMAERLHRIGVKTVADLLNRSASSIADALKVAKVDADLVRQWQHQATLVCRVPMLRGHDAQLLVAAGITDPAKLAGCDASWLLKQIDPIASSREGKAILRGSKHPDLAEMHEWISNAQQHRELVAA